MYNGAVIAVQHDIQRRQKNHALRVRLHAGRELQVKLSQNDLVAGIRSGHIIKAAVDQLDPAVIRERDIVRVSIGAVCFGGSMLRIPVGCGAFFYHIGVSISASGRRFRCLLVGKERPLDRHDGVAAGRARRAGEDFLHGAEGHAGKICHFLIGQAEGLFLFLQILNGSHLSSPLL